MQLTKFDKILNIEFTYTIIEVGNLQFDINLSSKCSHNGHMWLTCLIVFKSLVFSTNIYILEVHWFFIGAQLLGSLTFFYP